MPTNFKTIKFSYGENPVRVYEGQRISPRLGIELGYDLVGLLSNIWDGMLEGQTKCSQRKETPITEDSSKNQVYDIVTMFASCYEQLDKKKYLALFDKIMDSTVVTSKREDKPEIKILNTTSGGFDAWFSEFPEDLAFFTAAILVENAAPFLPARWTAKLRELGYDKAQGLKVLF